MSLYLQRYAHYKHALIEEKPSKNLYLSIVIPCFNEPDILPTLHALANCDAPKNEIEILIVVNHSENATNEIIEQNNKTVKEIEAFKNKNHSLQLHVLKEFELPQKHAGVGLARKIGMDEAARRNPNGVIVCLDADSLVEANYLIEIENHFNLNPKTPGCGIHFEHPTEGFFDTALYDGIIGYELHLRYFINAQKWAGHPHAYQTIGSSMAVRSIIYEKVGGMPKKQAGEDFYFLQKVIQLGDFTEIKSTKVIPSPRVSDRVPFGTGKAVGDYLSGNSDNTTYNFETFSDLKSLIENLEYIYQKEFAKIPNSIFEFLEASNGWNEIDKIINRSPNYNTFYKNFFNWFNAFQVMKYVHFSRDNFYPNMDLLKMTSKLVAKQFESELEALKYYRKIDVSIEK